MGFEWGARLDPPLSEREQAEILAEIAGLPGLAPVAIGPGVARLRFEDLPLREEQPDEMQVNLSEGECVVAIQVRRERAEPALAAIVALLAARGVRCAFEEL